MNNEIDASRLELERQKFQLDVDRWEQQKSWREHELALEEKKLMQAKRDTWVRGVVSGILGVVIAVSIPAFVSLYAREAEEHFNRIFRQRENPEEMPEFRIRATDQGVQVTDIIVQVRLKNGITCSGSI